MLDDWVALLDEDEDELLVPELDELVDELLEEIWDEELLDDELDEAATWGVTAAQVC